MSQPQPVSLPAGNGIFNFRVAGIAILDGKVLLHKTAEDNFWSLPGGRVDMFEFSRETLLREMMEETGMRVRVDKLAWIAENFFHYNGMDHHEIGFYFTMAFLELKDQQDFICSDGANDLLFRWIAMEEIDRVGVYPDFITSDLLLNKADHVRHFTSSWRDLHL